MSANACAKSYDDYSLAKVYILKRQNFSAKRKKQTTAKNNSYVTKSEKHYPNSFIAEVIDGGDVVIVKLIGTYQIKLINIYHG